MNPLDICQIERQAHQMRAEEMGRLQGLLVKRLGVYVQQLAGSALHAGNALQPLFSWNPQDSTSRRASADRSLAIRANEMLRACFSWNPQAHRS